LKSALTYDDVAILDDVFKTLGQLSARHATNDPLWRLWHEASHGPLQRIFGSVEASPTRFGPFGDLVFPFVGMGAVTSVDLFGLDELILFTFYNANRSLYRRAVDFGANIGLHTTIMARCGFDVRSFEPDPHHFGLLQRTVATNAVVSDLHQTAISIEPGRLEFVRVKGNTTGSHLAGAKAAPYGELERFDVEVEAALPHLEWADLAKIDIEGHEAVLMQGLPLTIWDSTDAVLEVGTKDNAQSIFDRFAGSHINLFAQKIGWQIVKNSADMPTSQLEGPLLVSAAPIMPR